MDKPCIKCQNGNEYNILQALTSSRNDTGTDISEKHFSLLWLPYVIIAFLFLCFLAVNFWCYHKKHRLKYLRKAEMLEARERIQERRLILKKLKSKYANTLEDPRQSTPSNYV